MSSVGLKWPPVHVQAEGRAYALTSCSIFSMCLSASSFCSFFCRFSAAMLRFLPTMRET